MTEQTTQTMNHFDYDSKDADRSWANGFYLGSVTDVEVKDAKSGEKMCVVTFEVKSGEDKQVLFDHIVTKTLFKMEALAKVFNRAKDFYDHKFQPADHIGNKLILELKTETTPEFGTQNKIAGLRSIDWKPTDKDLQSKVAPDLVKPKFS